MHLQVEISPSVGQIGENYFDRCAKLSCLGLNRFYTQIRSNSLRNCHSMNDFMAPTAGPSNVSKSNKNVLIPSFMSDGYSISMLTSDKSLIRDAISDELRKNIFSAHEFYNERRD